MQKKTGMAGFFRLIRKMPDVQFSFEKSGEKNNRRLNRQSACLYRGNKAGSYSTADVRTEPHP